MPMWPGRSGKRQYRTMRYASVQTIIWTDEKFRELPDAARLLFLYVLTSPHSNMIGYYFLPTAYAAFDLRYTPHEVSRAIRALEERGMVAYDDLAQVILVKNYLTFNPIVSPKQMRGAVNTLLQQPKSKLLNQFVASAKRATHDSTLWDEVFQTPITGDTLSKPIPTPSEPVSMPDTGSDTGSDAGTGTDAGAKKKRTPAKRAAPPQVSAGARKLAQMLYDALKERDALPADKKWFMQQALYAENTLRNLRSFEEWEECLIWALADEWWSIHLLTLRQLGARVWPAFARRQGSADKPLPRGLAGLQAGYAKALQEEGGQ